MEFGISLPSFGHLADPDGIRTTAIGAERLGYSSIWAAERLLVPDPPNQSWSQRDPTAFEPLTTLSLIAGITERIKLCTSVIILPVRNPVLLARMASSLDVLSNGRLELGIGVGWMREEMEVSGVDFGGRGRISDEYVQAMRKIWQGESFEGRYLKIPTHLFSPRPIRGTIPIWIGGNSDAALRRVGRLGDGWIPMGSLAPEELVDRIGVIRKISESEGRRDRIDICCNHGFNRAQLSDTNGCLKILEEYAIAGATHLIPRFEGDFISETMDLMEIFSETVMSSY
jgi:probable F420-dependent oxidoreductase